MPYYGARQEKVSVLGGHKGKYCSGKNLNRSRDFKNNELFLIA